MSTTVTITISERTGGMFGLGAVQPASTQIEITRSTKVGAVAEALGMLWGAHRAEFEQAWAQLSDQIGPLLNAAESQTKAAERRPESGGEPA